MQTYVILRRSGWRNADDAREATARSAAQSGQMPDDLAWIRSYLLREPDGSVGTVCIFSATSPEAIRTHARAAELPVDEIVRLDDTLIARPDPSPTPAP